MKKILALVSVLTLVGCGSTGVVPVGQNRYMISDSSSLSWNGGSVMANIIKEGSEFCSKQGKQFELIGNKTEDAGLYKSATAEVYFTCK